MCDVSFSLFKSMFMKFVCETLVFLLVVLPLAAKWDGPS